MPHLGRKLALRAASRFQPTGPMGSPLGQALASMARIIFTTGRDGPIAMPWRKLAVRTTGIRRAIMRPKLVLAATAGAP
jgi:hypothetical protein